jgi:hypothetical protein
MSEHQPLALAVSSSPTLIKMISRDTHPSTGYESLYYDTMSQKEILLFHLLQRTSEQKVACIGRRSSIVLLSFTLQNHLSLQGPGPYTLRISLSNLSLSSLHLGWTKLCIWSGDSTVVEGYSV